MRDEVNKFVMSDWKTSATNLDDNFGRRATDLRTLAAEALAARCNPKIIKHGNAVLAKVPSHVVRCKLKRKSAAAERTVTVPANQPSSGIVGQSTIKPLIAQRRNDRPIARVKLYDEKNAKEGTSKTVKIGNRLKKILRRIPAGVGMGNPSVAIAEKPGRTPGKRGAIFSYEARDFHRKRRAALAGTKSVKEEKWYSAAATAAKNQISKTSGNFTPIWE